jgi:hypothetical protein
LNFQDNFKKRTKNKRFSHIKPFIENLVTPLTFDNDIFKEICFLWSDLDQVINQNSAPVSIKNGILLVKVSSSPFIQELQYLKDEIQNALNTSLGQKTVKDIRFRLG